MWNPQVIIRKNQESACIPIFKASSYVRLQSDKEDSSQSFEKIRSSTAATAIRDSVSTANPKEESEAFHTANDLQFSTSAQAICDSLIAASKPIRDSVPTPNLIEESESYSLADFDRLLSTVTKPEF
uniref:Uncharacterized protein n=1 Tax=Ditylenchus dipsaci TaxID=166011 RepID=A0A915DJA8_9BILA